MNIIHKFKINYNQKLFEDLVTSNKPQEALSLLKETKDKNTEIFFHLLTHFIDKYRNHLMRENFFKNKVYLVNSFEIDDCNYLSNFFSFYFDQVKLSHESNSLANVIARDLEKLKLSYFPNTIEFQHFIQHSEFFFNSLLVNESDKNLFLKSNSAFFESGENNFFIYPNTTSAYFFIHKNPSLIYSSLKKKFSSSQEALNIMFNFQNTLVSNQDVNSAYTINENRQSWNIFTNSWNDPNVLNTFRGLVISQEEFIQTPYETLTKILFHLIQAGIKIEMNYELIEQYIQANPFEAETFNDELSNKEKKSLLSNLDENLLDHFNYQI